VQSGGRRVRLTTLQPSVSQLSKQCGILNNSHPYRPLQPVTERAFITFLYIDEVRASQETHLWASTACYGDSFTLLYADDVCTSQETHLWASTARYGDGFTLFYADDVRTSQETHLWASTARYGDSFTLLYADDVRTSQETHLRASTACYGDSFTLLYADDVRKTSTACYRYRFTLSCTCYPSITEAHCIEPSREVTTSLCNSAETHKLTLQAKSTEFL
jgi:hypothetical protein